MDNTTVSYFGRIQACVARVEGMKAENLLRAQNNESPAYSFEDFDVEASGMESLARDLF